MGLGRNEITIQTDIRENRKAVSSLQLGVRFVVAMIFFLSFGALLYNTLGLDSIDVSIIVMLIIGVEVALMTLIYHDRMKRGNKYGFLYPLVLLALIVIICIIFWESFSAGLGSYLNQLSQLLTVSTGKIHTTYETGVDSYLGVQIFSGILAAVLAYLCVHMAGDGKVPVAVILPLLVIAGVCTGLIKTDIWLVIFMAATAVMVCYKLMMSGENRTRYNVVLPVLFITAVAAAVFAVAVSAAGISKVMDSTALREATADFIHEKRFEDGGSPLPEGKLKNLRAFEPSDRASLQVSMSEPEAAYLRGFVGEQYDGVKWSSFSGETYSNRSDLFYHLHQQGFYGQSQLAEAYTRTGDGLEPQYMSIFVVSGCKGYFYTPYGLEQSAQKIADEKDIGDINIVSHDASDSEDYIVNYIPQAVKRGYQLQETLEGKQDTPDSGVQQYLDAEEAYRNSVYENYLAIPADTEKILADVIGEKETLSTTQAKNRILSYMNENILYKENVKTGKGEEDFIGYFLKKSRSGYCVHYASAAVLMLRYYGVPARYVEGYIITSSDVENAEQGEPVTVSEKRAHAWAEYYLDGVGWLPFETVPKYIDEDMYASTGNVSGTGEGSGAALNDTGESEPEKKNAAEDNNLENPLNSRNKIFVFKWVLVLIAVLILTLTFTFVTCWRRRRLKRFIDTFDGDDCNLAVENAFSYSVMLMRKRKLDIDDTFAAVAAPKVDKWIKAKGEYLICLELNEKSRFGCHRITEEERQMVVGFKDKVLGTFTEDRSTLMKIYDKWIRCIY